MWEGVGKRSEEPQMTPGYDEPKTIEELRTWFKEHGYEPAVTRFFVGVDVRSPKAFGIYRDELGDYIVYKNKADGTRVIRYQGDDQAFAVHELYQRFQQEIINQQTRWAANKKAKWNADNERMSSPAFDVYDLYELKKLRNERSRKLPLIIVLVVLSFILTLKVILKLQTTLNKDLRLLIAIAPLMVMVLVMLFSISWLNVMKVTDFIESLSKKVKLRLSVALIFCVFVIALSQTNVQDNGYYSINNHLYYRAGSNWYRYDDSDHDWERSYTVPSQLTSSTWRNYNNTESHHGSYESFEHTAYYNDWSADRRSYSESRDNDNDYDHDSWSSNDWDSGSTDWNSDW